MMESFMEYYFEEVFSNLGRDCLNERYKRRELVEYFNTVITGCAKGQNKSDDTTCKNFVLSALRYHNSCKTNNGDVCLMGKYHNLLYIAMKLAFDWSLQDNGVVAALLDELYTCEKTFERIFLGEFYFDSCKTNNWDVCLMGKYHNLLYIAMKLAFDWSLQDNGVVAALLDELYTCEKTFERIFLGAIFGTSAPHFLAGWKSDFMDREENVHALVYFLDHATNANLEYSEDDKTYRFIDVPLESCGKASPVRVVIQMGSSEMLMILLRFGASISSDNAATNPVESVLDRLKEYNRAYPYELVGCLKLILRVIPTIKFSISKQAFKHLELPDDYNYERKIALENYSEILEDHLVPSSRCGLKPVELKHLCRCQVRQMLWKNFELPFGIYKLPIPAALKKYLDLFDD